MKEFWAGTLDDGLHFKLSLYWEQIKDKSKSKETSYKATEAVQAKGNGCFYENGSSDKKKSEDISYIFKIRLMWLSGRERAKSKMKQFGGIDGNWTGKTMKGAGLGVRDD